MQNADLPLLRDQEITPGTRVLVRVDYNVSIEGGSVRGEFRIERSYKTIDFLVERGAKVILMSHIESVDTLLPVSRFLMNRVPHTFVGDGFSSEGRSVLQGMNNGEVVLLENLRRDPREKDNDEGFARSLSELGDLYVNDAFSVSHREHASIVGVPRFLPSAMGFLLEEEIEKLRNMFEPEKPFLFILGGAKFETKIPLITKFQGIADAFLIGGALANDIYKAKGLNVGDSLVSGDVDLSSVIQDERIVVPEEVVVRRGEENVTLPVHEVVDGDVIIDAAPEWVRRFSEKISKARTILWNGPLGKYEVGGEKGTEALARLISEADAYSVVGGGDTLTVIAENGLENEFGFISTGGGAMLDFLANGTLPGIEVLGVTPAV